MPRPKGWTDADLAKRDERVKGMLADENFHARAGSSREDRAYAIATAQVNKERGNG